MTALDALYRAQRAWERTQPQLFMELWPDGGLEDPSLTARELAEEASARTGRILEPAPIPAKASPGAGSIQQLGRRRNPLQVKRAASQEGA